jgi:adenylate cyclase
MADAVERARQREFGANRYMDDETAEVPRHADEADYTAEELAAARADWSDFNLQRPGLPRKADSRPRQVPDRGFAPENYSAEPADQATQQTHAAGAGATAPIPTPSFEERAWHRNIRELEHRLLGAERSLTYRQMAQRMGVSTRSARKLWRALGFPNLDEDVKAFTEADADALAQMVNLVRQGHLNEETAISLTRSIGQMTDRMVVWQIEALVEDKIANQEFSDAEARSHVFDTLPELIDPLHQLLGYAWRRQLSAALQRLTVRVESGLASLDRGRETSDLEQSRDDAPLPLARAVGFADLVSYTSLSRQMSERTLAHMVQRFESKCAEIISIGGGRLVKTVGDEVLFNAETPEAGAEIALALSESIAADDVLPEARVSVVWGRVLSRMGDIYGPTVNLAARLTSLADPGTILVDSSTAEALEVSQDYLLVPQPPRIVRGFGEVSPSLLLRARTGGIALDNA